MEDRTRAVGAAPPFPTPGPSGRFPGITGSTKALRLPAIHPASFRFLHSAVPFRAHLFALAENDILRTNHLVLG
jgi:hypothetical protein